MTDLRAAAQRALEALKLIDESMPFPVAKHAQAALRAALAQQEQAVPVALERERAVELTRAYQEGYAHGSRNAQQEQAVPAARVLQTVGQYHTGRFVAEVETVRRLRDGENLYTHPPRREWRGLTKEEIYPLYSEPSSDAEMVEFARAIEAALRGKNHE